MLTLSSTLLFAVGASAQLTTSIWAASFGSEQHVGFEGSVINVQDARTTLELAYDNQTNTAVMVFPGPKFTMTVGPTIWETMDVYTPKAATKSDFFKFHCEKKNPSDGAANATCSYTYGSMVASTIFCSTTYRTQTDLTLITRTNSGSMEVATQTQVSVRTQTPRGSIPAWCTESKAPDASFVTAYSQPNSAFATYQVVLTAGTEKLKPTQGAQSGAAMPMMTAAPVMLGLGAAIAAFVV